MPVFSSIQLKRGSIGCLTGLRPHDGCRCFSAARLQPRGDLSSAGKRTGGSERAQMQCPRRQRRLSGKMCGSPFFQVARGDVVLQLLIDTNSQRSTLYALPPPYPHALTSSRSGTSPPRTPGPCVWH